MRLLSLFTTALALASGVLAAPVNSKHSMITRDELEPETRGGQVYISKSDILFYSTDWLIKLERDELEPETRGGQVYISMLPTSNTNRSLVLG